MRDDFGVSAFPGRAPRRARSASYTPPSRHRASTASRRRFPETVLERQSRDVTNSHNSCCEITFTLCREGALMKESSAGNLEDTCSRERPLRRRDGKASVGDNTRRGRAARGCTRLTSLATCQRRQLRLPGHRSRAQPCLRVLLDRASRLPSVAARPHSRSRASTPTASAEGVAVTSWSRG